MSHTEPNAAARKAQRRIDCTPQNGIGAPPADAPVANGGTRRRNSGNNHR